MIRTVVVDDHPAIVVGIRTWLGSACPPIDVVDAGPSVRVAWTGAGRRADVVILDLNLGQSVPSYSELRRLVDDGRRVVVYTMRDDPDVALNCLDIGAHTYLTKAEGDQHLVNATRAAAEDRPYTPPSLSGALGVDARPHRPKLSDRETAVLVEWFRCESKEMVAAKLGLSHSTVGNYIDRIRIKYANAGRPAQTKAALVARAIQDGLVGLDDL